MLRRKKLLANINKEKINLADQPLPNAKRFLFGEDFPSIASKQAELSRGLAKNLSNPQKPKQLFQKSGTTKDRPRPRTTGNFTKYQTNRPKHFRSFRTNKVSSNQDSTTTLKGGKKSLQTPRFYMLRRDIKSLSTLFPFSYTFLLQNVQI